MHSRSSGISGFQSAALVLALLFISSCGGSSSDTPPPTPKLVVDLVPSGTYIRCENSNESFQLQRTTGEVVSSFGITCPSEQVLAGDFQMSRWTLQRVEQVPATENSPARTSTTAVASVRTRLPAPTLVPDGDKWVVLKDPQLARVSGLNLQLVNERGVVVLNAGDSDSVRATAMGPDTASTDSEQERHWRWRTVQSGVDFQSDSIAAPVMTEANLGFWGALTVGDTSGDGRNELLGMTTTDAGQTYTGYPTLGLNVLFTGRDFRDVRLVDLNNDGLDDIVGNVYGAGCTLIGMRNRSGGYSFSEPTRADGSCVGGYGETILIADFDGNGLLDMLLPAYQRFDLLMNQGNGVFVEVAEELGLDYPDYMPRVEGGAAADINLDGHVDIVVANEVLINDGRGRFNALPQPFGPERVPDEGMSVVDLDRDGHYDILKNDPFRGPRPFWGAPDRRTFIDSGWLFGGDNVLDNSFGVAVGYFSGHWLPDVVIAGGAPAGLPPRLCVQSTPRHLECKNDVFAAHAGAWQDLLLVTDVDQNGVDELYARYGVIRSYSMAQVPSRVFTIDLRDTAGKRNQHGRSMRASCSVDNSPLGLRFVDGGNGYMSQGSYEVTFGSNWCTSIWLDVATPSGTERFGPFKPGRHELRLTNA